MKFAETHFIDFLDKYDKTLHPQYNKNQSIYNMNNIIIYGPPGIGKYTYALNIIQPLSDSNLKYEKNNYYI